MPGFLDGRTSILFYKVAQLEGLFSIPKFSQFLKLPPIQHTHLKTNALCLVGKTSLAAV